MAIEWGSITVVFIKYGAASTAGAIFGWMRRANAERNRVRRAIKRQLRQAELIAEAAYTQIALGQGNGTLPDQKQLERLSELLQKLVSRLVMIEELDANIEKAIKFSPAIELAGTLGGLGRFARRYCCDGQGRNAYIALQNAGQQLKQIDTLDEIFGVPEAIQKVRYKIGGRNITNKTLITAREKAKATVRADIESGKLGKGSDPDNIFLTGAPT